MGYGDIVFRCRATVTREAIEKVIATALGAPVETEASELEGNPHDTYFGNAWIRGKHATAPIQLVADVQESAGMSTGPRVSGDVYIELQGPASALATKLDVYQALRDGFAALGYTDDADAPK